VRDAGRRWLRPAVATLLAIGVVAYFLLVFLPTQAQGNRDAGMTGGNGSDLYSRWYGTRELLQRGRDPYSAALTAEMNRGFYGRDPRPGESLPPVSVFAQPLYTAFLLAPLTLLDFPQAQWLATWTFPLLIALGALLWQAVLAPAGRPGRVTIAALALSAPATLYDASLQQLSALVFLLIAGGAYMVARRRYLAAGALLALSTIKPQEGGLLIVVLLIWTLWDWPARRGLALSFFGALALLSFASLLLLPGWIGEFFASLLRYTAQTGNWKILSGVIPDPLLYALTALWVSLVGWGAWQARRAGPASASLGAAQAAALAASLAILPTYLLYERIYLIPALLALLGFRPAPGIARVAVRGLTLPLLLAPWALGGAIGLLELAGAPMHDADVLVKLAPWLPYVILPHLCAVALLTRLAPAPEAAPRDAVVAAAGP
jgi:hypothetical protein